ncbi:hypothetical protein AOQ84DRAFT_227263 [Glonium stellatum]|uniref:Uncharacterized protein n=1 Tax=Glonium stellatum TaxID=574774 RepID=A0A8E2JXC3_9PEZI|nr:hypothetical protein AOQ84DRAFT_227263 [Glonium stellatum]
MSTATALATRCLATTHSFRVRRDDLLRPIAVPTICFPVQPIHLASTNRREKKTAVQLPHLACAEEEEKQKTAAQRLPGDQHALYRTVLSCTVLRCAALRATAPHARTHRTNAGREIHMLSKPVA